MLLEDRVVGPTAGAVELGYDEAVGRADLIDAVLVAREPEDAARALEAAALDGRHDDVGREVLVRDFVAHGV